MPRINSRKKGKRGERKAREVLNEWTGLEFAGVPASGGLRWKKAENISGDIVCTDALHRFDLSIEVKNYADINFEHLLMPDVQSDILKFWKQCKEDAARGKKLPLLMMRYDGMRTNLFFVVILKRHFDIFLPHLDKDFPYFIYKGKVFMNSFMLFNSQYKTIKKLTHKIVMKSYANNLQ